MVEFRRRGSNGLGSILCGIGTPRKALNGVFGKRIYHAKKCTFPAFSYYTSREWYLQCTLIMPFLILSGMVLAITCRDCTFMNGTVLNLYSRCLWPKTPILPMVRGSCATHLTSLHLYQTPLYLYHNIPGFLR